MHKHTTALIGMVLLAMGIALLVFLNPHNPDPTPFSLATSTTRVMSIEDYVRENISEISPMKEQLGGRFYVTGVRAADGMGTVSYEDGHDAYRADFTYILDVEKGITITSFTMRP